MKLYFVTGNKTKFQEVQSMLPEIEQLDIDLPEIQEIDAKEIIKYKLQEALNHVEGSFLVEDTSLYMDCLQGLPGPLVKWFLKTIDNRGMAELAEKLGNNKAQAKTIIGYAKSKEEPHFFEGVIQGTIAPPVGEYQFGWDPIFKPEGYEKTFAQMGSEEKSNISMRRLAVQQLQEFLQNRK